jgi:hypothetical protein
VRLAACVLEFLRSCVVRGLHRSAFRISVEKKNETTEIRKNMWRGLAGGIAPAPPRSYGQRHQLVAGTSPRGKTCHSSHNVCFVYSAPLKICRVVLLLPRQRRGAAGLGELE